MLRDPGELGAIDPAELKAKLDGGQPLSVVCVLGEWAFRAKRIPGSRQFGRPEEALRALDPHDEVVVYCCDDDCGVSTYAHQLLESRGFRRVRRLAGGLVAWEAAGFPTEGELAVAAAPPPDAASVRHTEEHHGKDDHADSDPATDRGGGRSVR